MYERTAPAMLGPSAVRLVDLAAPGAGEIALDLGCGTGIVARLVYPFVGPEGGVIGIDTDPAMLEMARLSCPAAIEFSTGDAADLTFQDGVIDLVLSQRSLEYVPDKDRALAEAARVLKPGGRFFASVWGPIEDNPFWLALREATFPHLSEDQRALWNGVWRWHDHEPWAGMLKEAGFTDVEVRDESYPAELGDLEVYIPAITAAAPWAETIAALPPEDQHAIVGSVSAALGAGSQTSFAHTILSARA